MVEEAYVSFEVAKLLKEKGFVIPVRYEYHCVVNDNQKPQFHRLSHNFNGEEYSGLHSKWYSAPTHQMACKWLREKHHILITIIPQEVKLGIDALCYGIYIITEDVYTPIHNGKVNNLVDSYEEAVEAALKYALENLI